MDNITLVLTILSIIIVLTIAIKTYIFIYKMITFDGEDFDNNVVNVFGPFFTIRSKKHSWD